MNNKTAFWIMMVVYGFWIMMVVYGLDALIITPYLLMNRVGREVGLLCAWGYYKSGLGLSFFYIWFLIFGILLWFILKYSFMWLDRKLGEKSKYPKYAMVGVWTIGMAWTIIHNLGCVFN